jgi:hypothetical protein
MRTRAATVVLASTFVVLVTHAQQLPRDTTPPKSPGTASIRGRVITADTGDALRKVRITASAEGARVDPVFSDTEGRFQFLNLPAGRYLLSAAKAGFAPTRYGARRTLDQPIRIDVADRALVDGIEIRMPKGGVITGRVVDDLGEPMMLVNVTAGRLVRNNGRPRLVSAGAGMTDDLGEYRISGLTAGSYIVGTAGAVMVLSVGVGTATTSVFYPGGTGVAQAQPVAVRAGDEVRAIDFTLTAQPMPKLTVTVTDVNAAPVTELVFVTQIARTSFGPIDSMQSFAIQGGRPTTIPQRPGDWIFIAQGTDGSAIVPLTVGSDDASLNLVLSKGGRLSGDVVFEGSTAVPAGQVVLESVIADLPAEFRAAAVVADMKRDRTFEMTNLAGPREFRLRTSPPGWILKSLTAQGRSLLDGPVEFKGGENLTGVQAVLTNQRSRLSGTVVDREKTPVRVYSLLVFPEDRTRLRNPARWIRWVRPDQNGRFLVDDLLPGDYLAIALDDVDEAEWLNADYLERLRLRATRVTLGTGEPQTITLELASTP